MNPCQVLFQLHITVKTFPSFVKKKTTLCTNLARISLPCSAGQMNGKQVPNYYSSCPNKIWQTQPGLEYVNLKISNNNFGI